MPEGREGFDYCPHGEEPDYCDGCLYIRQKDHGRLRRVAKDLPETVSRMVRDGLKLYNFPAETCGDRHVIKLSPEEVAELVADTIRAALEDECQDGG